ncbi:uncharacterized protein TNCV_2967771 [Trichonephila clavipes]|nr:uncharacterized protein TNCV_2967771 [Trichonephila clavipes]
MGWRLASRAISPVIAPKARDFRRWMEIVSKVPGSLPSSFHTLPKLSGSIVEQPWTQHVFYRRKIRRSSRPGKQFNLVIDEEPLDSACHVWSRIILLKYGCGQALKVRKDNCLQHLGDVALPV